ncbi:hypothetical protein DUNSADRAFT_3815 [Dunaliella salina]|uniref:Uncharacterized protein n=1 Tax=Dunaliella salina TaxID=3046 RepID=A0ABQ7FVU8_DUNSA|nr:hypothetical protein DUNSADRAFT_3815 [Dunaliella salina]|eukprot:KAF5826272.1 hypothetical protein DUNSADRAFT_3815 [Dunaliella salina]
MKCHDVFHISLLKLAEFFSAEFPERIQYTPPPVHVQNNQAYFIVDHIVPKRIDLQSEQFQLQLHLQRGKMLAEQQQQQQQQQQPCQHQVLPDWSTPIAAHIGDLLPDGNLQVPDKRGAAKVDLVAEQTPGAAGAVCAARIQHASSEPLDVEEQAAWVREQEARQAMQKQRLQQLQQQQQQSKRRRLAKQQQLQQQQQQEEGGTGVPAAAMQEQRLQRQQQQQQQQQQQEKEGTGVSAALAQQAASECAIHNRPASLRAAPFPVPTTFLLPQTAELTHPAHGSTTSALAEAWRRAQPQQHVDLYPPGTLQPVQPSVPQPPRSSQRTQHDGTALHVHDAVQPAQPSAAHPPRSSQLAQPGGIGLRNPQALHPVQPSVPHPPRNSQHAQPGGAALRTPKVVQSAQPSVPHPPTASQYLQPGGAESRIPRAVHPVQPSVPHPSRSSQHAQPNGREHDPSKIIPSQTLKLVHASAPHPQNVSPQVPLAQTSALNPHKAKSLQPEQPAQPVMHQPPPNTLQRTQPMGVDEGGLRGVDEGGPSGCGCKCTKRLKVCGCVSEDASWPCLAFLVCWCAPHYV